MALDIPLFGVFCSLPDGNTVGINLKIMHSEYRNILNIANASTYS